MSEIPGSSGVPARGLPARWPMVAAAALALIGAGALSWRGRPGGQVAAPPDRPRFDAAAVRDRVQHAFRRSGEALRGSTATYEVSLERGVLEVVPRHHPAADRVLEGAGVRLSPARIDRGGALLADGAGVASVTGTGQVELAKGPVTERLANGPEGLEQSWRFAARPEGRGALAVRIPVAAGALAGETARGLHLAAGPLGLRYGHGTWIDARGTTTPVPARWDQGAIVLSVPDEVLERSAYPAVLDPVLSPELQLDEPVFRPAIGPSSPAVAWDGTDYLVVWCQRGRTDYDIYGARVSGADGSVLDVNGIAISAAVTDQVRPAVACGGTTCLVAWSDFRDGFNTDVYGARVSAADGSVLDGSGFLISSAAGGQVDPAVAWDGTNYLVVWATFQTTRLGAQIPGTGDIQGRRVRGADGALVDADDRTISSAGGDQSEPAVAWDGSSFLVVWRDARSGGSDIRGAPVRASDGAVLDGIGFSISTAPADQVEPALAWDGTSYLVVWTDLRGGTADIYGARVSGADRVALDADGVPISTATGVQVEPAVAWGGTQYLVAWSDQRGGTAATYGARVRGGDGAVLDADGVALSTAAGAQREPALASNGADFLVARMDAASPSQEVISVARVGGADAAVLDGPAALPAKESNTESRAAVASDGTDYLVVWEDDRSGTGLDIYGTRVGGADGAVLDRPALAISTATSHQVSPAVAWDGTNYLVVWSDSRSGTGADIYGARVRGVDGAVLEVDGIAISTATGAQVDPAVAWDGTNFLVVWSDGRSGTGADIYGARVSGADGSVLEVDGIAISTAAAQQVAPAVAWDGTNHLVVWQDNRSASHDIQGARVRGADGAVLDGSGLAISTAESSQLDPAVAWGGTHFLVAWTDNRGGAADVNGARVSGADGSVLDVNGFAIAAGAGGQTEPAVAWDGMGYLVAWTDFQPERVVSAKRVSGSGVVLRPDGVQVSGPGRAAASQSVAAAAPGRALVVYQGAVTQPALSGTRIIARGFASGAPPVAVPQAVTTAVDTPVALTLGATDADGDPLSYVILAPPQHGVVGGDGAGRTYVPEAGYIGPDSFTFAASDGLNDSEPATVSLTVMPPPVTPPAATPTSSGCGCATGGEASWPILLLLGLLGARRRRSAAPSTGT